MLENVITTLCKEVILLQQSTDDVEMKFSNLRHICFPNNNTSHCKEESEKEQEEEVVFLRAEIYRERRAGTRELGGKN